MALSFCLRQGRSSGFAMKVRNLLEQLEASSADEQIASLIQAGHVRIERIVSHGHVSPEGFWYDQDEHEFVVLLSGAARLRFAGEKQPVELKPGDYLNIEAHRRHRVEWTTPNETSVWLAVFYADDEPRQSAS
jgi:cupin 2 domain-containing protein